MQILMIGPHKDKIKGGMSSVIKSYVESKYLNGLEIFDLASVSKGNKIVKGFYCLYSLVKLLYYMLFKDIDIVHVHTASGKSFYRKSLFINISKLFNKKIILHIHGGGFEEFYLESNSSRKANITKIINKCDKIIVLSDIWKSKIRVMTEKDIAVVSNSVDLNYNHKYNLDSKRITFVGRVEVEKGIFDLVEVASDIIKFDNNIKFVICGDGDIKRLKEMIKKYKLEDNFELLGWINKEDINNQLRDTEIFVLPSHKEAMPMSILEAMNYGIPIIATETGSIPEFVKKGRNGITIEVSNKDKLKKSIIKLLKDRELRKIYSNNNYEDVKNMYCDSVNHKKLKNLYFQMINEEI